MFIYLCAAPFAALTVSSYATIMQLFLFWLGSHCHSTMHAMILADIEHHWHPTMCDVCVSVAAWKDAQAAAEEARQIEHDKWALAQRLGRQADEATAERLSVMHERVSGLKKELTTVKEEVTTTTSSSSTYQSSSSEPVDVSISGKGNREASVKVAVEE